jgi:hypothetical protein
MSAPPNRQPDTDQREAKIRMPYHTPRMEDYGAVNELTRSDLTGPVKDGPETYTSV